MLGRGADSTPESRGPTDDLTPRGREILEQHRHAHNLKTDRMFLVLLLAQWAFAVVVALVISPFTWAGKVHAVHQHVWTALIMGGVINSLPILLIFARPGRVRTRHVIAVAQMLWSGLFIHLTGGRIETHFHVFGSLAFLAFYRDWRLLVTATLAVAADHLVRGLVWPESVYGILNPEWWRFLEHAFWVAFENTVLVIGCLRSQGEMQRVAGSIASLERVNAEVEERVTERTAELGASREQYRALVETASVVPWEMAPGRMSYVGPQVEAVLG